MKFLIVFILLSFFVSISSRWPPGFNKASSDGPSRPPSPRRPRHRRPGRGPGRDGYDEEPEDKFINSLTNNSMIEKLEFKNFDEFVKKERDTIILFFNETNQDSQDIIPEFINLTKFIAKNYDMKKIGYVNGSSEKYLVEKNKVEILPTILFFLEEKETSRFEGFKNKDQIALHFHYMINYDSFIEVKTFREADSILEEEYISIIAFFTTNDNVLNEAFQIILDDEGVNQKNYPQIIVKGPKLMKRLGRPEILNFDSEISKCQNVIGVIKNYAIPEIKESYFMEFEPDITRDDVRGDEKNLIKKLKVYRDFIKKHARVAVIELIRQDNYPEALNLIDPTKPTVVFFLDISFEKQFRKLEIFLDETFFHLINDKEIKNRFNFFYANADQFSTELVKTFLIRKLKYPMMMIQKSNFTLKQPNIYYLYDNKNFTDTNIRKFLNEFNNLNGTVVSEAKPKTLEYLNKTEIVRTIVANTFDDEIINIEKDVFLMFYHEENEISKIFMPIFPKLAEKFKNDENLIFAKINIGKNYIFNSYKYEINESLASLRFNLPKLFYFKKEDKLNPIRFRERKKELDLIHFINNMLERKEYDGFGEEVREIYEYKLKYGVKVDPLPPIVTHVTIDLDAIEL